MVTINHDGKTNIQPTCTQNKIYFSIFPYFCVMETIKPKRGRTKVPENQRKKLMSAYLTDEEKNLILAKYESLTNAVRNEILPKLLQNKPNGHSHPSRD